MQLYISLLGTKVAKLPVEFVFGVRTEGEGFEKDRNGSAP